MGPQGGEGQLLFMGGFRVALGGTDCVLGRILDLGVAVLVPELIPWIVLCAVVCVAGVLYPGFWKGGLFWNIYFLNL